MKAIVFAETGGPEVMALADVPRPEAGPGKALLKMRESADRCFALMREGKLRLHIGKTFPLAQAADAHRYIESRESTGKLILVP